MLHRETDESINVGLIEPINTKFAMSAQTQLRQHITTKMFQFPSTRCAMKAILAFAMTIALYGFSYAERPNILIAISDDQSHPYASAYGTPEIQTPGFDRVARQGILFHSAFTPAPGCSPMRAAFLTGREIWQIGAAGTHASDFPRELPVFTEQLEQSGYHVGMTGKGWGPGRATDWPHNPAGKSYSKAKVKSPAGISSNDYATNFEQFLEARANDQPFCFWFGGHEPHRTYQRGIGKNEGIDPQNVHLPKFLPDSTEVRSDIADFIFEVQWFDSHLNRMLDHLESIGEAQNTIVIVTSDNGMPFPRAKANLYEDGIHMPLAMSWPASWPAGQNHDGLVSLIDVTRTIFDVAEIQPREAEKLSGHSLMSTLSQTHNEIPTGRAAVYSGRERHSSSRFHSLGYPSRCIRTKDHLYIRNFTPERWPAGTPQKYSGAKFNQDNQLIAGQLGPMHGGYHDIDDGPTLQWMIANQNRPQVRELFLAAVAIRPAEELYNISSDPACLQNLALQPNHQELREQLSKQLEEYLAKTGDLRVTAPEQAHLWEMYPRHSSLRWFQEPEWWTEKTKRVPTQPWLEAKRPRDQQ